MRRLARNMRRAAIASLALLIVAAPAATAGVPETVLATSAFELKPAASGDHLAWVVYKKGGTFAYEKPFGGSRVQVNPDGTDGVVGAIDGIKLIYQQFDQSDPGSYSDIYLFDLQTHHRTKLTSPVNTTHWEYSPGLSGRWVLFARWFQTEKRKLFLYNRMSGELRGLATTSGAHVDLSPGQVNGGFVVYSTTRWDRKFREPVACDVYRYNIETEATLKISNAGPKCQYSPSVSSTGTMFFGRSGFGCGLNSRILRYPGGGPAETLVSIPSGHDLAWATYAVDNGDSTTDVYYDYGSCTGSSDIKKITAAT